jgi:hypothetical protein
MIDALRASARVLPGRLSVLIDPRRDGAVSLPDSVLAKIRDLEIPPYDLDTGTVIDSGVGGIRPGDRVAVLPREGLAIESGDFPWMPEGREVRIYKGDILAQVMGLLREGCEVAVAV